MSCYKEKTANEVLDYLEDWSSVFNLVTPADTMATSVWTVDAGLTIDSQSDTGTESLIWVSGGTLGMSYNMTIKITTTGGRTHERAVIVEIVPAEKR